MGEKVCDLLSVPLECQPALGGHSVHGSRPVCDKQLLDGYVVACLKSGHVCVDVAVGESGLSGEVYEVGFVDDVQVRHDDQSGRFVDETVDLDLRRLWVGGGSIHGASVPG